MITSPDNPKLKLIRRLAERRHRSREGLFVAEGEDLIAAARAARREPEVVLRGGIDVEQRLLDSVSALGSGTRVIGVYPQVWAAEPGRGSCVYLHAVADPRNVGAIVRTADALVDAVLVLGPGCADPYSGPAVRTSMGSIFSQPIARGEIDQTPAPRVALVAHGGEPPGGPEPATLCLGAERAGLPDPVLACCERRWTIPLRSGGAESLNVAAAAAIALGRISSAA
jgi:TrmH family RNA methyltransferase